MPTIPNRSEFLRTIRRSQPHGRPRSGTRLLIEDLYDDLVANPPKWEEAARQLNEMGHRDADGHELSARSLASIFARVKAERAVNPPSKLLRTKVEPEIRRHDSPESRESHTPPTFDFAPTVPRKETS